MPSNFANTIAIYTAIYLVLFGTAAMEANQLWWLFSVLYSVLMFIFGWIGILGCVFDSKIAVRDAPYSTIYWLYFLYLPGALTIWMTVDGEGDIPPGYRFLALFYKYRAHSIFEESINSNSKSPIFRSDRFSQAVRLDQDNRAKAKLETEAIREMKVAAEKAKEELRAQNDKLQAAQTERFREMEELNRKIEEVEILKAKVRAREREEAQRQSKK